MARYFVSFGQFFEAENKADALSTALQAQWAGDVQFGAWVSEELPQAAVQACVEIDPSTGLKHWEGADQ